MIKAVISDANILIDYTKANDRILSVAAANLFEIYIPSPVFNEEIRGVSSRTISTLGLKLIEPTLAQLGEASAHIAGTSQYDRLCYILARDNGWACLTNDKRLRRLCEEKKVACVWGLNLMTELVKKSLLTEAEAIDTAQKIASLNRMIAKSVVEEFERKIKDL